MSGYKATTIDRAVFATLGVIFAAAGLYLVGPWYLDGSTHNKAPLLNLFNNATAVKAYGVLLLLDGLALLYASAGRGAYIAKITAWALLAGFLLRLYSLIGVILTLGSWRPPSYLSHAATVVICGAYWVWVRVNERPTE